jgi:hypothetical protein
MSDPADAAPRRRVHPLDLLVLVLAAGLAALAYAYLFRTNPIPLPMDPYLGAEVEVEFIADREWKRTFGTPGAALSLHGTLACEVLEATGPAEGAADPRRTLRLRIAGREHQRAEALTHFRTAIRRGFRVRLVGFADEVEGEVTRVTPAPGPR